MKDPDLLGKPNYTIHSNHQVQIERTSFLAIKYSLILVSMALWFFFVLHKEPSNGEATIVITIDDIVNVLLLFLTPYVLSKGINAIGETTNSRYSIGMVPMELRLYDDCAVKYIVEERFNTFILMPYENIRQCKYSPDAGILCFTGNFRCVSFFSEDKQHSKPNYKEITTVNFPIYPSKLSGITTHSPIEIYKVETEGTISEKN